MIVFLTLIYVGVLALLVKMKIVPNKPGTWLSIIAWVVVLFVALFIPMQWGAPAGPVRILTYSVQIIPNVSGPVSKVIVEPNQPMKKGSILFEIDDTLFKSSVSAIKAQLEYQEKRLQQFKKLASSNAGTRFQVEETQAQVDRLKAEFAAAEWNLQETVIRAPSDGFVTTLALRPGQRVTNMPFMPAMTFIDTSKKLVGAQIHQIYLRHLKVGQPVEIAFKAVPGRVFSGKVETVIEVSSQGQVVISGTVMPTQQVQAEPFFVRIELDEDPMLKQLKPGMVGTTAIYTESVGATHIIRKVMIRMEAIINYVNPML
ncbi:MAG: HlyD family secretion protein [Rhizobiaceae bacterium]|nr:HlyD family secretion protein [Rhizobiaceae bacterium]MBL4696227.1 HlyD family secretion protein [Rhizobiaceae bacterium]